MALYSHIWNVLVLLIPTQIMKVSLIYPENSDVSKKFQEDLIFD